ncbi:MAG: CehA/McbA family metallohydrolase [Deltaproteobacteria bacterium]
MSRIRLKPATLASSNATAERPASAGNPSATGLLAWLLLLALLAACGGSFGQELRGETVLHFSGKVPTGEERFFFLPFDVPPGTAEIEIRHDDLSEKNILDWGVDDPAGFRGWGGGNRENAIIGREAASGGYLPGPLPAGKWEIVVGKALLEEDPALYEVEITLRATATRPAQAARLPYVPSPALDTVGRWYSGDFHLHSLESDGSQTMAHVIDFAESRGLDFILFSEHNTTSQLSWYADLQAKHADLLLVPGTEFTSYQGHANAIGTTGWINHRIGTRHATIAGAIAEVHAQGGLFSINHPLLFVGDLCLGCGWEHDVDPQSIDAIEIRNAIFTATSFWEELLAAGSHAAALGGSDDHHGGTRTSALVTPVGTPTTWIFAHELSVAALLEGIRAGRTFVQFAGPDAPRIESTMSGPRERDTVRAESAILHARVENGRGKLLRTIRNGARIDEVPIDADPFAYSMEITAPITGEDRYRHEIIGGSETLVVASHIWLQR